MKLNYQKKGKIRKKKKAETLICSAVVVFKALIFENELIRKKLLNLSERDGELIISIIVGLRTQFLLEYIRKTFISFQRIPEIDCTLF